MAKKDSKEVQLPYDHTRANPRICEAHISQQELTLPEAMLLCGDKNTIPSPL